MPRHLEGGISSSPSVIEGDEKELETPMPGLAEVWTGIIKYRDWWRQINVTRAGTFVQLDRGAEDSIDQHGNLVLSARQVAVFLKYEDFIAWVPTVDAEGVEVKRMLIHGGIDENGDYISLTPSEATLIAQQITEGFNLMQDLMHYPGINHPSQTIDH